MSDLPRIAFESIRTPLTSLVIKGAGNCVWNRAIHSNAELMVYSPMALDVARRISDSVSSGMLDIVGTRLEDELE